MRRNRTSARDATKRVIDVAIALPAVLLTSPLVGVAWLAIRVESSGSVIYRQTTIGKDGRPFAIYKLRTMVEGAERIGSGLVLEQADTRITRSIRRGQSSKLDHVETHEDRASGLDASLREPWRWRGLTARAR